MAVLIICFCKSGESESEVLILQEREGLMKVSNHLVEGKHVDGSPALGSVSARRSSVVAIDLGLTKRASSPQLCDLKK